MKENKAQEKANEPKSSKQYEYLISTRSGEQLLN